VTIPIPDIPTPTTDPTAHLHALVDVLTAALKRSAHGDALPPDALDDPLLMVTLGAPARAYACSRNAAVLGAVDVAMLPAALVQAIGAFIESGLQQLDPPTQRETVAAIERGAEPVVTFRPLTGHAKLLLMAAGAAPVELVALRAQPVVH
jgi:hypothetical protein